MIDGLILLYVFASENLQNTSIQQEEIVLSIANHRKIQIRSNYVTLQGYSAIIAAI